MTRFITYIASIQFLGPLHQPYLYGCSDCLMMLPIGFEDTI